MSETLYNRLLGLIGVVIVISIWQLTYDKTAFLPAPVDVFGGVVDQLQQPITYNELAASGARLLAGLGIGAILGVVCAMIAAEYQLLRRIVQVWINATFTVPSLLAALLCLIVLGITDLGVIVAVSIIVFPFIAAPVYDGIRTADDKLLAMTQLYRFNTKSRYLNMYLPHVGPFLVGGLRNGHALAWRVLIVAEIFSVRSGLGHQFDNAFDSFDFVSVIVWLLLMLSAIGLLEIVVLSRLERWATRWQKL